MERSYERTPTRLGRRRRWRRNRRGVVSVVGTLLALLVFFALFGVFITQYVPIWMTDNESAYTARISESMATLKSNLDLQIELGNPPQYASPFQMESDGIPLLAQPTSGILNFVPTTPGVFVNVSMTVGPGGGAPFWQNFSLGTLVMTIPNRYYSPQTFQFEDDAVVQSQAASQQVVAFPPLFTITQTGTSVGVTMTMVQLFGNATQAVSTGAEEVYTQFLTRSSFTSTGLAGNPFNAKFVIGTHYPCAWGAYLAQAITKSGVAASHFSPAPTGCVTSTQQTANIPLGFVNINSFTLVIGEFQVVLGVGVS